MKKIGDVVLFTDTTGAASNALVRHVVVANHLVGADAPVNPAEVRLNLSRVSPNEADAGDDGRLNTRELGVPHKSALPAGVNGPCWEDVTLVAGDAIAIDRAAAQTVYDVLATANAAAQSADEMRAHVVDVMARLEQLGVGKAA